MKSAQPTREKILDAVYELVYIHGYNGTSMSMILEACAIPKGSLYHFFKSKKELVLSVLKERISPRMDEFYELKGGSGETNIDAIIINILKLTKKEQAILYGCPLNRLNQEMSAVDKDFEREVIIIYDRIKNKIKVLLDRSKLQEGTDTESLADYIIESVWGALSLPPEQSSKERYLRSVGHLITYLKSLKS
jgi:TetR/AcrR family transcriptional regulator, transcriptional repressor for nem operon